MNTYIRDTMRSLNCHKFVPLVFSMMILIVFFVSICTFLIKYRCSQIRRPLLPPGPRPLPYIGCLISMLRNKPAFRWIQRTMDEMNTKILCIRLGNVHVISVSDPKIACEILKEKDEIFSSRPDCMSSYLTSGGYQNTTLVPMNNHWKKMRRILATNILSEARHKWLQNKRDQEADNLLRYIYNQCKTNNNITKGVVNVRNIAKQYTSNIMRSIILGSSSFGKGNSDGGSGEEEIEHGDSIIKITHYVYAFCVSDYFPWLRWITDFDGHERMIRKTLCTARKYQDPLIDKRIQQWKDGSRTKENDLLDVFINLDPPLSAEQIKIHILDLMLGSFDNAPNCVEWAITEMINEPRFLNKAIHELDSVIGKDRLVQEYDIHHLNYIKSCLKEAFRLHPVSPFSIIHLATTDTTVAGYFIPKGSHVLLSRSGLGRNPDVWDDPLTFNPDRHMKDNNEEVVLTDHNLQLFSFGTGRRGCPGVLLGSTMTVMLMARLIQGFVWELPPNETYVDLKESHHDLWKAKPLLAVAKPRFLDHIYHKS